MKITAPYDELKTLIENSNHALEAVIEKSIESKILKQAKHKHIIRFRYPNIPEELILKIVYPKGHTWLKRFFRRFNKSSCMVEYQKTHHFNKCGIGVVMPVMAAEKRFMGLLKSGYYVAPIIKGTILLADYLAELDNLNTSGLQEKRALIRLIGQQVGQMHGRFLYHCDLTSTNILIKTNAGGPQMYLIDCGLARIHNCHKPEFIARDLTRLRNSIGDYKEKGTITSTDLLRFAKAYCSANTKFTPKVLLKLLN